MTSKSKRRRLRANRPRPRPAPEPLSRSALTGAPSEVPGRPGIVGSDAKTAELDLFAIRHGYRRPELIEATRTVAMVRLITTGGVDGYLGMIQAAIGAASISA